MLGHGSAGGKLAIMGHEEVLYMEIHDSLSGESSWGEKDASPPKELLQSRAEVCFRSLTFFNQSPDILDFL